MVNFADAVTKVSYGKLRTTTPNARGVGNFLHNVASTNKAPLRELSTLAAEDAMYSMGAKNAKPFVASCLTQDLPGMVYPTARMMVEPCGIMQKEIVSINRNPKVVYPKSIDAFI